jgi:hypothetical protein
MRRYRKKGEEPIPLASEKSSKTVKNMAKLPARALSILRSGPSDSYNRGWPLLRRIQTFLIPATITGLITHILLCYTSWNTGFKLL